MPHIVVKLYPGRSEALKMALGQELVKTTVKVLGVSEKAVSVAFEEIPEKSWFEAVVTPDILEKETMVYINPYKQTD